ncbi:MAG TPA: SAM-dependent methyltransferase [Actinomycetota bacterium]|nr:SAM-dependent methyltransferase [Actinomycetota bacterium]
MATTERPVTGSLTIVGSGIRPGLHTTSEARARIVRADKVLYLLAEPAPTTWIEKLNPSAESLTHLYESDRTHDEVYEALVEAMLVPVRAGLDVCMVTYGNPAVFDESSHEAVRRARAEGYPAKILPGVSALDCLFVDLGVDPGRHGLQTYEGSDFALGDFTPNVRVPLVLWQISVIGNTRTGGSVNVDGLRVLADRLAEHYGADHEVTIYEATPFPVGRPLIERCAVRALPEAGVTGLSTLYVPPLVVRAAG